MGKFSTKGVDTTERRGSSQFISPGVQMLAITGLEVRDSKSDRKQYVFKLESPKVVEEGFEAHEDAKQGGKIGKVPFGIFMNDSDTSQVDELIKNVGIIADKLGVRDAVDAIEATTARNYLEAVVPIFRGKFAWWAINGEQYLNQEDKVRTRIGLRRFGFIAAMDEGEDHLKPYDKTDPYDFKPIAQPDADPEEKKEDDGKDLPWD